jgi:prolipoprotein diacylglyceryltransferase
VISATLAPGVHGVLEAFALMIGFVYYRVLRARAGAPSVVSGAEFAVALGCIFGAAVGNKLVFWIEMPHLLPLAWDQPAAWLGGQSMVGGLLGGLIGVEIAKKLAGVTRSTGDAFVYPVLLGLMIGRVGCFLAGLADGTYGLPTELPWGVDFGDGIPRHPTQLYEIAFAGVLWLGLRRLQGRLAPQPGLLFKMMLVAYLLWRLAIDALKPVPFAYPLGFSGIQWVCLIALIVYLQPTWRQWQRLGHPTAV